MDAQITNAVGNNDGMKVDMNNRAHVQSLSINYEDFAVLDGESFGVLSPVINLTTDNISYLLYVSNTNSHDLVLDNVDIYMGTSDAATKEWLFDFYIAPSGGTLITAGSTAFAANNNLGSSNTLSVTATSGIEGSTVTGGIPVQAPIPGEQVWRFAQKVVIPSGTAFAIGVKPPAGNTSANVTIGTTIIRQVLDLK